MYSGGTFQLQGHYRPSGICAWFSKSFAPGHTTGDESCDSVITVLLDHETPDWKIELAVKIGPDRSSENHEY
jgi:hypothetical protein